VGKSGKNLRRKIQQIFQTIPTEAWAGILFSSGRNVLMPRDVMDRKSKADVFAQLRQGLVLSVFEGVALQAFKFDADRIVIAVGATSVGRLPRVPSAVMAADKLPKRAVSANVKMRRNLQATNALKVRVRVPIELVGEQALHVVTAVLPRWQADGVHHDQINASTLGSRSKIG
jgi:hypothetical protein